MGSWVEDFDAFPIASPATFELASGVPRKLNSKKEKLESELKLLQWHKLANEAAIKAAIIQTKSIKEIKLTKAPAHTIEDAKWMKKVIDQERIKPLEVSKDFVISYDKKEKERSEKLSDHVDRHIASLKALREKVESRQEVVSRSSAYRAWRKDFYPKKQAVLLGKTLDEFERDESKTSLPLSSSSVRRSESAHPIDRDIDRYARRVNEKPSKQSNKELSNVLDSLQKLSELENRISSLENDNVFDSLRNNDQILDQMVNIGTSNTNIITNSMKTTKLQFKKHRVHPGVGNSSALGPMKVSYSIKTKTAPFTKLSTNSIKTKRGVIIPQKRGNFTMGRGGGSGGFKNKKAATVTGISNNKGVFLTDFDLNDNNNNNSNNVSYSRTTQMDDQARLREEQRRERQRQLALASAGQKNLRGRIQDRKQKMKEAVLGAKRHEEAMQEIIRRRQEIRTRKPNIAQIYGGSSNNSNGNGNSSSGYGYNIGKSSKGASSGIKTSNKYLRDFQQIKEGMEKKKEDFRWQPDRASNAFRNTNNSNNNSNNNNNNNNNSNVRANNSSLLPPLSSRAPLTKVSGTITRRTEDVPLRRRLLELDDDDGDYYHPTSRDVVDARGEVAVAGLSGLRAIRNNQH